MEIEASGKKDRLPTAARLAFDLLKEDQETNGATTITQVKASDANKGTNGRKVVIQAKMVTATT